MSPTHAEPHSVTSTTATGLEELLTYCMLFSSRELQAVSNLQTEKQQNKRQEKTTIPQW